MTFLTVILILVAASANAKNLHKHDDYFNMAPSDSFDSDSDMSIPELSSKERTKFDENGDSDFLEEDEDYTKPLRLNAAPPTVRKAKQALQVAQLTSQTLDYINFFRRLHGASPLQLLESLTVGSQKWANSLVKLSNVAPDKSTTHNQTVCQKLAQQNDGVRDCVIEWYGKVMNYDWAHKKINKANQDFVVMINRATTHVGLGFSRGALGKVKVVAFYSPRVDPATLRENILPFTDVFAAVKGAKCGKGYTEHKGTCYKIHTEKKNWMGAVVECGKESATLADIKNAGVESVLKAVAKTSKLIWIGLNDRITEGMYSYIDGSPVSHLNWRVGEPQGKDQNCEAIDFASTSGTMYDKKCTDLLEFVCKKPLEGDVLYQVTFELPLLNFKKDFSNQESIDRQKLNEQIEGAFKLTYKGVTTFKKSYIVKVSDELQKPKPVAKTPAKKVQQPAKQAYNPYASSYGQHVGSPYGNYYGKRDEISPTATSMPSSSSPTLSSSDSLDDTFLESFEDKSKKVEDKPKTPPKKTYVTAVLKFGIQNLPADPTKPLQAYLAKNKGRSAAPLSQNMKILSVKLLPPGSEPVAQTVCEPTCASTCTTACSPNCCFQPPSYSSYQSPYSASPCVPTPYNPCAAVAQPPAQPPKPKKPKMIYNMPQPRPQFHVPKWPAPPPKPKAPKQAPCTPTPATPCTTQAYQYGAPSYQPAYSSYGAVPAAAPCGQPPMNPCQTQAAAAPIQGSVQLAGYSHYGKRSVVANSGPGCGTPLNPCGSPPMAPQMAASCGPPQNPCSPPLQMPMVPPMAPQMAAPCGPSQNPCSPPMQMPMVPPMGPPMPPPMLPPMRPPCGVPPMNPCSPPMQMPIAAPMTPPMQPPCGMPPLNPCGSPMGMQMQPQLPFGNPFENLIGNPFGNPCTPQSPCPPKKTATKSKGKKTKAVRRCGPSPFSPCGGYGMPFAPPPPQMPYPMQMPMQAPMQMPMQMPVPYGNPCVPTAAAPCPPRAAKKPAPKKPAAQAKPSAPKPIVINGMTSPYISGFVLPAPPAPYMAPPPIIQFTGSNPCLPTPMNPCAKRGPIVRRPQPKTKKPVAKNITPVQSNGGIDYTQYHVNPPVQSMPFNPYGSSYGSALPSPLGVPLIPGMNYPKCLPNPTNPCKPLKFKTPRFKPVIIKLKSTPIQIKVPQNPNLASLMQIPTSNCPPSCNSMGSFCPSFCSKRCCMARGKRHE